MATPMTELENRRYFYRAVVVSVYDGDTLTLDIDLGYHVWLRGQPVRLHGLDAPEVRGGTAESKRRGVAARDWLRAVCLNQPVFLDSTGKDKYGRWLGVIYAKGGLNLNDEMLRLGLAVPYDGTGERTS